MVGVFGHRHEQTEWIICPLFIVLVALYIVVPSRRARMFLFLGACGLGMAVGLYGFVNAFDESQRWIIRVLKWGGHGDSEGPPPEAQGYFRYLGLPLSLVVACSFAFAVLELEKVFIKRHLRRYVYPALAWYFAIWIAGVVGFELAIQVPTYTVQSSERIGQLTFTIDYRAALAARGAYLVLLVGFVVAAWRAFPRLTFRIVFPAAGALSFVSIVHLAQHFHLSPEKAFLQSVWLLFWLVSYFYINVKHHETHTKSELVKRVPKTALFLVAVGVFHEFPQYEHIRQLFPRIALAAERVLMALDVVLFVTLIFLVMSNQIFDSGETELSAARES